MKKKDIDDLKRQLLPELEKTLKEKRSELRTLRFDLSAGKVKNVAALKETKRIVARILTFIKQSKKEIQK